MKTRRWRLAALGLLAAGCLHPAHRESSATPATAQVSPPQETRRQRAERLRQEGKLRRALRVIEQDQGSSSDASQAVLRLELLADLERVGPARRLADELEASAQLGAEERARVREVRARLTAYREPAGPSDGLFGYHTDQARLVASRDTPPAERQRQLDRVIDALERLSGTRLQPWGGGAEVSLLAWSPDGQRLAAVSELSTVQVIDTRSLREIPTWHGDSWVRALSFSPGGVLAAGRADGQIAQLGPGRQERRERAHATRINALAHSPDGRWLASGADDGVLCLHRLPTTSCDRTLVGHDAPVLTVAFSADGRRLFSSDQRGALIAWELSEGKPRFQLPKLLGPLRRLLPSPRGDFLAALDANRVTLLDLSTGQFIAHGHFPGHEAVAGLGWARPTGAFPLSPGLHFPAFRDLPGTCRLPFPCPSTKLSFWASQHDCHRQGDDGDLIEREMCPVGLWQVHTSTENPFEDVQLSPDGRWLAVSHREGEILLEPATLQGGEHGLRLHTLPHHDSVSVVSDEGYADARSPEEDLRCGPPPYPDLPMALCRERWLVPDLLARTLRGDLSYRDP